MSVIRSNVIVGMQALIKKAKSLDSPWVDETLLDSCAIVERLDHTIKAEEATHLERLWLSAKLQEAWLLRDTFTVGDNLEHFMKQLEDLVAPDFYPTVLDFVQAEARTTGKAECEVMIKGRPVTLVDVGGQRCERRKWRHYFDQVSCVVFIVNLNSYNRMLYEDHTQNRLLEDLDCFEEVVNTDSFKNTPFFLIFNFRDLFQHKIESSWDGQAPELSRYLPPPLVDMVRGYTTAMSAPLSALFPDYTGGPSFEHGLAFIRDKFLRLDRRASGLGKFKRLMRRSPRLTTFTTCMLDTQEAQECMNQIISSLIER